MQVHVFGSSDIYFSITQRGASFWPVCSIKVNQFHINFFMLETPLFVFKPMFSVYLRKISTSVSHKNLNCELKGMPQSTHCSLPA